MKEKKIVPVRRKNLNPTEEYIDKQVIEIATSSDPSGRAIRALKNIFEAIHYCDEYKMYYVRDLAISRAIRRCDLEIEFMNTPCKYGDEGKLLEDLAKKYDLT